MSTTLTILPKKASRDIEVVKLVFKGEVRYYPWYERFNRDDISYEINKITSIRWGIKDLFDLIILRDTSGGIYSYPIDNGYLSIMEEPFKSSYIKFLKDNLIKKGCKEAAILKCVIPKGTLFYECVDSKSSYKYKMVPQLVSKSIIPIDDVTNCFEKIL